MVWDLGLGLMDSCLLECSGSWLSNVRCQHHRTSGSVSQSDRIMGSCLQFTELRVCCQYALGMGRQDVHKEVNPTCTLISSAYISIAPSSDLQVFSAHYQDCVQSFHGTRKP